MAGDLRLYTCLPRLDIDGEPTEVDAVVWFNVARHVRGCAAVRYQANGDPGWPAEPDEFDFEFAAAEIIEQDDAPGPLTSEETDSLRAWFGANYSAACEAANDNLAGAW